MLELTSVQVDIDIWPCSGSVTRCSWLIRLALFRQIYWWENGFMKPEHGDLQNGLIKKVLDSINGMEFDFCLVDGGYVVDPRLVQELKRKCKYIVNFNVDDPFSSPHWRKWRLYRESIPEYDLLTVVRTQNISEVKSSGAKKVLHVFRMADEVAHKPMDLTPADKATWASDVCFVGTWMPERGPFMAKLIERGVPLSIWGNRWRKSKEWKIIQAAWKGPGIYTKECIKPILSSKIWLYPGFAMHDH